MARGVGFAPVGASLVGYGTVTTAPAPTSNAVLPDAITGLPQPGRLLNPATQSYQFTSDGRMVGQSRAAQLVQLAMSTIRGSAVVSTLGVDKSRLQEKGANLQQTATSVVTDAFAPIVSQKLVALKSVDVQDYPGAPDRAVITIQWTDLTTGQEATTVI
jgi:hypothetical protein